MKRFISIAIVITIVLSLCVLPVSALTSDQATTADKAYLLKYIRLANGVTAPDCEIKIYLENDTTNANHCGGKIYNSGVAQNSITVTFNTFSATSFTGDGNSVYAKRKISDIFSDITFEKAGKYYFKTTEIQADLMEDRSGVLTSDSTIYDLEVIVKNGTSGLEIETVTALRRSDGTKVDITSDEPINKTSPSKDTDGDYVTQGFTFDDAYSEDIGTTSHPALQIHEDTTGKYADLTKEFSYTIKTSDPTGAISTTTLTLQKYTSTGVASGSAETITIDTDFTTAKLKNGEYYQITTMPKGLTYEVIQTTQDSKYTTSLNGKAFTTGTTYTTGTLNITSADTVQTYANAYADSGIVPTGVENYDVPFVILAIVSLLGIAVLMYLKHRENTYSCD